MRALRWVGVGFVLLLVVLYCAVSVTWGPYVASYCSYEASAGNEKKTCVLVFARRSDVPDQIISEGVELNLTLVKYNSLIGPVIGRPRAQRNHFRDPQKRCLRKSGGP